jgi:hypothetical protein
MIQTGRNRKEKTEDDIESKDMLLNWVVVYLGHFIIYSIF